MFLRYRPANEPLDYWVAHQAGYLLRLLELPPGGRFDFAATGAAAGQVQELLTTGQPMTDADKATLPQFAQVTVHWAMMKLRSYAIGMRSNTGRVRPHRHANRWLRVAPLRRFRRA